MLTSNSVVRSQRVSSSTATETQFIPVVHANATNPVRGKIIYDIDTDSLQIGDGTTWSSPIPDTGVAAGTYGSSVKVPQITISEQGTILSVTNIDISGGGGSVSEVDTAIGELTGGPITTFGTIGLANTTVTPGSYTNANITVDAKGRITLAANGTTGTVIEVDTTLGELTGGPITTSGTLGLANTTVTPGSYSFPNITVDSKGRITAAATETAVTSVDTTLGELTGGPIISTGTLGLANTAVTPGSYTLSSITVDAKGRVTAASTGTAGTVTSVGTTAGELTGGPITTTGTLGLADTAVIPSSYTLSSITVDAKGRLTAASSGTAVTSVGTTAGELTGGPITTTGTLGLANTAVTLGSYTLTNLTVDAKGRITAAANGTAVTSVGTTAGDLTGGPITTTGTLSLATTAVTPGSYTLSSVTVDSKGRLTAASNGTQLPYDIDGNNKSITSANTIRSTLYGIGSSVSDIFNFTFRAPNNGSFMISRGNPGAEFSDPFTINQDNSISAYVTPSHSNLKLSANGTTANITITADMMTLNGITTSNLTRATQSIVNVTINSAASGANGLDTGAIAASTWYAVFVIMQTDGTLAGLISLSSAAPTMPSGYIYRKRVGWIRTDGTANKFPLNFIQRNNKIQYNVQSATNVTAAPVMVTTTTAVGSPTVPTWVAISLVNYLPTTAYSINGAVHMINQAGGSVIVAPTNSYGAFTSTTNPPPVNITPGNGSGYDSRQYEFTISTQTIYWATNVSTGTALVQILGWEDNL